MSCSIGVTCLASLRLNMAYNNPTCNNTGALDLLQAVAQKSRKEVTDQMGVSLDGGSVIGHERCFLATCMHARI